MKNSKDKKIKYVIFICGLFIIIALVILIILLNSLKNDSNNQNTVISNTTTDEKNIEYYYPVFNKENVVLNYNDNGTSKEYTIYSIDPQGFLSCRLINGKAYIYKENLNNNYITNSVLEDGKGYEIKDINENIINVHAGRIGKDYGIPTILLLTEGGKLYFVDTEKGITTGEFSIKSNTLENIVRLENVLIKDNNEEYMSIIAISKDGTTYNLVDFV